jgi:hypothetical protein
VSTSPILNKQAKQVRNIRGKKNVKKYMLQNKRSPSNTQYLALSDVVLYEKIILSGHAHGI